MRRRPDFSVLLVLALVPASSSVPRVAHAAWAVDGGAVVLLAQPQTQPVLAADPTGGVFFGWVDARSGYNTDINAAHWSSSGSTVSGWTSSGDALTFVTCQKYDPAAVPDGTGGALFTWSDDRCAGYRNIYARRVASSGVSAAGWANNGVRLATSNATQSTPAIAPDGAGGAFVAWQDMRGADADIYLQHVDGAGAVVAGWPAAGLGIAVGSGAQVAPSVIGDGAGGVFVTWQDRRAGHDDIYLQYVTGAGAVASGWTANGLLVCGAAGDQRLPVIDADGAGGVVLAWQDQRAGGWDVYCQRVQGGASLASGWSAGGVALCTATGDQVAVRIVGDGGNGLLAVWQDRRGGGWDIYAARRNGAAALVAGWSAGGTALTTAADDQTVPGLAPDGAGGAYFAWQDRRTGGADIQVTRLAADGSLPAGWIAGGNLLCGAGGEQTSPRICARVGGGAFVTWADQRNSATDTDVYAMQLLSDGPARPRISGLTATHHDGQTFLTWTSPQATGWTHRIYYSPNPIAIDADLDTATLLGSVGDSSATDARLSGLLKVLYTFRTDSGGPPLPADKGLFVVTVPASRQGWYAVTPQLRGSAEDRRITPGVNALASPVGETLALPRPVHQRAVTVNGTTADVYTLWTWPVDTPLFPAMSNRAGWPYDCSVTRGTPMSAAFMRPHQLGGSFTEMFKASGTPGEWVVAFDDYTLNNDLQTFWYGYHAGYDMTSNSNLPPLAGPIIDYTNRRVLFTIRWARATFAFDTTRCYAFGYSLGATYSMRLALTHPELVAAAMGSIPKLDFSFLDDPNPAVSFNSGNQNRLLISRLWGTVESNLMSSQGLPVYTAMNDDSLASRAAQGGMAFHVTFNGKNDLTVGWAEKLGFLEAIRESRHGGVDFWDNRDHFGLTIPGAFAPMLQLDYLYRFRSDLSWPAFTNCSTDGEPGDGSATSGDSLGSTNGHMEWEPAVVDSASHWQVTLSTRPISTLWGTLAAPESLTVDVTPRRLQRFALNPGESVIWSARRLSDGAVVQAGNLTVDALGLVTVPQVTTYRTGTRLVLVAQSGILVAPPLAVAATLGFAPLPSPTRAHAKMAVQWPRAGSASVELFDTNGRRMRTLLAGEVGAGIWRAEVDLSGLAPGVYLMRARQGNERAIQRIVLLR